MTGPLNVEEYEALARERLTQGAYDYIAGGSGDEIALRGNVEAFRRRAFRYRVLVDVSQRDLECELLGTRLPFPILLAPTAGHRLAHPDGEAETARGAASVGALMTLSTISTVSIEDVAAAAPGAPRWFQLYCYADPAVTQSLVKRAEVAGYSAIVLTVDVPVLGTRERDHRNSFALPPGVTFANFDLAPPAIVEGESQIASFIDRSLSATINWDDVAWIKAMTTLPLLVKGLVRSDDAARAVDAGFDGVWVSNHGGRQLDRSIPTADALPDVVEAVAGRVPVIVDGGVRRGTDVLCALAMGASAVAIGRPQFYGLAAAGADGVRHVLEMLRDELSQAMALAGCRSIAEIDASLLA